MDKYYGLIALVIYIACLIIFLRYEAKHEDDDPEQVEEVAPKSYACPLDTNDEDTVVASLVAAIECRNEFKKNVQIVSVRKVN